MPRKRFYPSDSYPYHVSGRSHNKEWFRIPIDESWVIFSHFIGLMTLSYNVRVHAFVLMDNHFHMLISTPDANLDKAMNYFMREVSNAINRRAGKINQTFGGPYHWSVIKNSLYYDHAYKYVYRNPVEAGICNKVEDYPYSSLRMTLGLSPRQFPTLDNMNLISNPIQVLKWLNCPYPNEKMLGEIRNALKHRECEFYANNLTQKKSPLAFQRF